MSKGEILTRLREEAGIKQTYAAEQVGISKQTLYKYEHNIITNIPSDVIEKLATLYNTSPAYIMGWITDDTNFSIFEDIVLSDNFEIWDNDAPESNYSYLWNNHFDWNKKSGSDTVTICKRNHKDELTFEKVLSITEIEYLMANIRGLVLKYIYSPNPSDVIFKNMTPEENQLLMAYRKAAPETQAIVNKIFDIKGDTESEIAKSTAS